MILDNWAVFDRWTAIHHDQKCPPILNSHTDWSSENKLTKASNRVIGCFSHTSSPRYSQLSITFHASETDFSRKSFRKSLHPIFIIIWENASSSDQSFKCHRKQRTFASLSQKKSRKEINFWWWVPINCRRKLFEQIEVRLDLLAKYNYFLRGGFCQTQALRKESCEKLFIPQNWRKIYIGK